MSSSANATVTAPVGAGLTATAVTLNGVRKVEFDPTREMLFVQQADGRVVEFEYATIATVTYVIANKVATVTVST
jgi:hypothetical protein